MSIYQLMGIAFVWGVASFAGCYMEGHPGFGLVAMGFFLFSSAVIVFVDSNRTRSDTVVNISLPEREEIARVVQTGLDKGRIRIPDGARR